jgi:DNA-binding transcriptional MerR regulator/uncharacterized protein (DUF433 family)
MTAIAQSPSHVGVGLYSLSEAARILRVPIGTVRRWVSQKEGLIPIALNSEDRILTFAELMEIHFIKIFREEGVSFHAIKLASERAARQFHTKYPFSVKRFDTDGSTIFSTLQHDETDRRMVEDLAVGQLVFEKIMRPFFRKLEYNNSQELVRYWPMAKRGRIVLDPARKFGKPIESTTGIPTHAIYEALTAGGGQSPAVVATWLGIPLAAVKAAAAFEQSLAT